VPTDRLVDELFAEIDRYYESNGKVHWDAEAAAEARAWLAENEDLTALTPERLAAMEAQAAAAADDDTAATPIDEALSPAAGRRFTRT